MSWRALIDWALSPIFTYAGNQWAGKQLAHFAARSGFSDDEADRSIGLGGCGLAEELRRHAVSARPTHDEFFALHHGRESDR